MRYVVEKQSGSEWARVMDTETKQQVAKYNVLPKRGNPDGWGRADLHAAALNKATGQHARGEVQS